MQTQFDWADFLQRFSTKVLWHFTGYNKTDEESFNVLKNIIGEKKLKKGQSPIQVIMPSGQKRFGHPCSCMCDIPFKDLRIHTARYGKYGIAFDKNRAITQGYFNPVLYVHKNHFLFRYIEEKILNPIDTLARSNKELREYLQLIGTYLKVGDLTAPIFIGNIVIDELQNNNFYYEREWRSAYDWKFENEDIETIMIPKSALKNLKIFLEEKGLSGIPIISYEMIDKL